VGAVAAVDQPDTHLCLVAPEALPNLLPALSPASAPGQVILLWAPPLAAAATRLAACLQRRGIACTRWEIADTGDPAAIQRQLARHLATLPGAAPAGAPPRIALNASGGSRAMAIAATALFRAHDLPIFCVAPAADRLVWLHPAARPVQSLDASLALTEVLAAQGLVPGGSDPAGMAAVPPPRQQLCAWLAEQNRRLAPALTELDRLATHAPAPVDAQPQSAADARMRALTALIQRLALAGVVRIDRGRVRYADRAARAFVQGGWIAEHCLALLQERSVPAALMRVEALAREDGPGHPADLLCLARNRLHLMVCLRPRQDRHRPRQDQNGSRRDQDRPRQDQHRPSPSAATGIQPELLQQVLAGSDARVLLLGLLEPPPAVRRRAAELGIQVCAGSRLAALPATLRTWIDGTDQGLG